MSFCNPHCLTNVSALLTHVPNSAYPELSFSPIVPSIARQHLSVLAADGPLHPRARQASPGPQSASLEQPPSFKPQGTGEEEQQVGSVPEQPWRMNGVCLYKSHLDYKDVETGFWTTLIFLNKTQGIVFSSLQNAFISTFRSLCR